MLQRGVLGEPSFASRRFAETRRPSGAFLPSIESIRELVRQFVRGLQRRIQLMYSFPLPGAWTVPCMRRISSWAFFVSA